MSSIGNNTVGRDAQAQLDSHNAMENILKKSMITAALAGLFAVSNAKSADVYIVGQNNLANMPGITTEGVKNGTSFSYYQGFATGPSGNITQLSVDLSLVANSAGQLTSPSNPDTAAFYLYSYSPGSLGTQIGGALATVTAGEISGVGTYEGTVDPSGGYENIYQYDLIAGPSSIILSPNTDYAIVMVTSSGSQEIGWAESNTKATGDEGEISVVNQGGSQQSGAYAQMELAIDPPNVPDYSSAALLLSASLSTLGLLKRKLA
jgi:hypothetical protein